MADNDTFNATDYFLTRYGDINVKDRVQFQLDKIDDLFQATFSTDQRSLKVLDYGCGPIIQHSISAAAYASEVVFCDISSANCEAIKKWLRKDPDAFNWSPHFDYVVQTLEGKGEKEAREREEQLRKVGKIVFCDALSETPMEKGYEGPYDVILECGCLDAACANKESYRSCMKVLASLLKPGGTFIRYSNNCVAEYEQQAYHVGDQTFHCICFNYKYIVSFLKQEGFVDVQSHFMPHDPLRTRDYTKVKGRNGFHFVSAKKL